MRSRAIIPIAILVGGIIVAGAVYFSTAKNPSSATGNPALVRPVDTSDHILGNPVAKVMIVEYSDFDCDYCKDFNETLHQIIADEGVNGQVAWVYREFPLIEIHPNALSHARAAECVAEVAGNEAFWRFGTALFNHQPTNPSSYGTLAKEIGLTGDAFATCMANNDPSLEKRIMADRQNALDMGAQGTPYSIILVAGKPPVVMDGRYPYNMVKDFVTQALAN